MAGGDRYDVVQPHRHAAVLGTSAEATAADVAGAVDAALAAAPAWRDLPFDERAAVLLRAAELLSGPWRDTLNAATMLGQSQVARYQAEIDAAASSSTSCASTCTSAGRSWPSSRSRAPGVWNRMDHRPLEGFVLAITPFNFTAIAGNLPLAPALMGNTVVWKPSPTQQLAAHYTMRLLEAAGLPPGVINLVTGDGAAVSEVALAHRQLAGIHFTGSTATFQQLWSAVGGNLERYAGYPRLVGETGGKDFVRRAPERRPGRAGDRPGPGRVRVPGAEVLGRLPGVRAAVAVGGRPARPARADHRDDRVRRRHRPVGVRRRGDRPPLVRPAGRGAGPAAARTPRPRCSPAGAPTTARASSSSRRSSTSTDPTHEVFTTEYFGPILGVLVYDDADWSSMLAQAADVAPYALTGSVFATDRAAIVEADRALRFSAGNFYVNDKPTGAVVGQQPFGGARASGTNDKAGSILNLQRWVSPRTIKETFDPPTDVRYPHQG